MNRLSKTVIGPQFEAVYIDYYIRDAQGNFLATYRRHFDYQVDLSYYTVAERAIYGSDRMGVYAYNDTVYPIPPTWVDDFRPIHTGHKKYELKNHLGNVMAVVHGRKQAVQGSYGVISHYTAIPAFSGDYSAFGVKLRGRGSGDYRYGFQDQEHDTETFRGGSVNYKYRMHRPDLGRFFSVDPLHRDYPWNSGYAFRENRVVDMIELEGLEMSSYESRFNRNATDYLSQKKSKDEYIGQLVAEGKGALIGIGIVASVMTKGKSIAVVGSINAMLEGGQQMIVNKGDLNQIDLIDVGAEYIPFPLLKDGVQATNDYTIERGLETFFSPSGSEISKSGKDVLIEGVLKVGGNKSSKKLFNDLPTDDAFNKITKWKFEFISGTAEKTLSEGIKSEITDDKGSNNE